MNGVGNHGIIHVNLCQAVQRYITHVISLRGRLCCMCAGVQT